MVERCPHLGMVGDRQQVIVVPDRRHRCYLRGQPERVATVHQGGVCLTSGYRRCPRLKAAAADSIARHPPPRTQLLSPTRTGSTAVRPGARAPARARHAELRRVQTKAKARRRWNLTELVVATLTVSILLACSFVGYMIAYRAQIGPGMAAPSSAAQAPGAIERPALVATFTSTPPATIPPADSTASTPEPTPDSAPATPSSPTSIPEPTLTFPTPTTREPASSPPTRLSIPGISLDIPVIPVGVKTISDADGSRVVWADVPNAGAFHQTSAYPGNPGNTVINGHRDILGSVFRNLNKVKVGDEIKLYVGDVEYLYYVTETLIVPETFASASQRQENLRLIGYMPEERLTLVTCTPIGLATHRLLVIAEPPMGTEP
jgi:sortase A